MVFDPAKFKRIWKNNTFGILLGMWVDIYVSVTSAGNITSEVLDYGGREDT